MSTNSYPSISVFFSQLRSFSGGLEAHARSLRQAADGDDMQRPFADVSDFFEYLRIETQAYTRELNATDTLLRGGADRLHKATLEEVLEKCVCLHQVNQTMVRTLEEHLQQYGYQPIEKPNLNFDLQKLVPAPPISSSQKNKGSARKPLTCIDNVNMSQDMYEQGMSRHELMDDLQSEADMVRASFLESCDGAEIDESQSYFVENNHLLQHQTVANTPMLHQMDHSSINYSMSCGGTNTPEQVKRPVENAKTPSLDDWKLSAATRNIIQPDGKRSAKHSRRHRNATSAVLVTSDDDDDDFMPESPPAPTDLSWIVQPCSQNDASSHQAASPPGKYDTPPQAWPDRRTIDADTTPPTPSIPFSPFATFQLKDRLCDEYGDDNISNPDPLEHGPEGSPADDPFRMDQRSPAKTPLGKKVMNQLDSPVATLRPQSDDESSPLFMSSPPKLSKLLNPRRESLDGDNWIPLIETDEYSKWPVYVRRQVPLEVCNDALIGINEYLALEERKTQSFTEEEISPVVQSRLANVKLKTMLNALVVAQRMAVGQEGGITVYMVKRFYAC